ncbi:SO2930 family diheme c-type cytochrome [Flavihumibacter fluvii]|uniref:SO2930 family diheme c-type cytochrome n=1 Tax=Flavihumibacter fluvii TaxID=2838157 RepID=UPI001BDDE4A4|nr:SO2930 family diheme c-type cytochrome [Flavihumibacter fluvii]ULQ54465.1 hypothetical protein KJS93_09055 [Flavihumibacter fluvii]
MKKSVNYLLVLVLCTTSLVMQLQSCKNSPEQQQTAKNSGFEFKARLSEYGFFTGVLKELHPSARLINYDLASPLFSDYSVKDRFIWLPLGQTMKYVSDGLLDFPDSTIIIKNFAYQNKNHERIMLETRLLVKDPAGKSWKVMTYLWNKEQTDAEKFIIGKKIPIELLDSKGQLVTTNYQVPNTNDCKSCHVNTSKLTPIGPKARNLNFTRNGESINQLELWASTGQLTALPPVSRITRMPDFQDSVNYSLDQRARAYLDINCAHCHTRGGDAYNTGLFLEFEQNDPNYLGIMKSPVSAGGGAGGMNFDIVPGHAKTSILAYRMNSAEPGTAMPELGRSLIHHEGVDLVVDWINAMKPLKK